MQESLWIAFKSLYLWYSEQLWQPPLLYWSCCELLSKVCIFDILSNRGTSCKCPHPVVNCFQKFVSLIFWATDRFPESHLQELWIAFKSLYLWYSEQRTVSISCRPQGCELLSKVCIFDILSNLCSLSNNKVSVVNCFQKFVSLIFWATVMEFIIFTP